MPASYPLVYGASWSTSLPVVSPSLPLTVQSTSARHIALPPPDDDPDSDAHRVIVAIDVCDPLASAWLLWQYLETLFVEKSLAHAAAQLIMQCLHGARFDARAGLLWSVLAGECTEAVWWLHGALAAIFEAQYEARPLTECVRRVCSATATVLTESDAAQFKILLDRAYKDAMQRAESDQPEVIRQAIAAATVDLARARSAKRQAWFADDIARKVGAMQGGKVTEAPFTAVRTSIGPALPNLRRASTQAYFTRLAEVLGRTKHGRHGQSPALPVVELGRMFASIDQVHYLFRPQLFGASRRR
jgi:hypothetical protein